MIQTGFFLTLIEVIFRLSSLYRWVFRCYYAADGNFKVDHIRQKNSLEDVWLLEGGGMMPQCDEYHDFLKMAIEWRTASEFQNEFIIILIKQNFLESTL